MTESEQWLNIALQASRSGAFVWDAKTDESYWSDEMLALYGMTRGGASRRPGGLVRPPGAGRPRTVPCRRGPGIERG